MSFVISWSPEYATGIDIIDEQHKRIFDYLSEIDQAIKTQSASAVEYVVKSLFDYAISHNSFEEGLMEKAGYPMLEPHRRVHESFKSRTQAYAARLENGEDHLRLAREVRTEIGLWLTNHIKRDDQHYVPCVKKSLAGSLVSRVIGRLFG